MNNLSVYVPSYLQLYKSGELLKRIEKLEGVLTSCNLCPQNCKVNRLENKIGFCNSRYKPIVSTYCIHYGEEPILVGTKELNNENGVGNIFFGNCNLRCVYCQNYEISQNPRSAIKNEISIEKLSEIMLELQDKKVNSIGFVSPTHFAPQILMAIEISITKGLRIPLIYNTNSYDNVEVLRLFDGVIDIYLPDIKYSENKYALKYSYAKKYVYYSREILKEMYRQVENKIIIENGILKRGIIIRHLVLPNDLAGSFETLKFIADIDKNIMIAIMAQYYPTNKAANFKLLSRHIKEKEYERVLGWTEELGLKNILSQEFEAEKYYRPNFRNRDNPFNAN